ncbi:MAG: flippase-like domain-containing protein [Acidimicrobiales bacterium]|jgi:undecaprenyl-diphosphatase|nr:flippase-like domain-containing protein [Acidimicrobiales bacterium]
MTAPAGTLEFPTAPSVAEALSTEDEVVGYERSPSDLLRLLVFGVTTLVVLALTRWAEDSLIGFERDVVNLFGFLSPTAGRVLAGAAQVLVIVVGLAVFVPAFTLKRYRLIGYILASNVAVSLLMGAVIWWLDRAGLPEITNEVAERAGVNLDAVLSPTALSQVAASFVVLAPFVSGRWRRAGVVVMVTLTLFNVLLVAQLPAELLLALVLGAMVGAATLLAFGRPDQRPTFAAVRAAMSSTGLPLAALERASVDARGSTPYFATLTDGTRVFAKALSPDERSADLLFRVYRFLRLKNIGDERPFSSLRRTVEHEALVSLQARDVGVRTPRMRAIAAVGADSMLLAYDMIDGRSMDRLEPDDINDDLLRRLWEQVAVLRTHRIAHRDLRRANVFVAANGDPWIIDFGFSEVAASDQLLAADVAQLVAALSVAVGAERAVASAVAVLGPEAVGSCLPYVQYNALSGATRTALKAKKGLIGEVQDAVATQCQVEHPAYVELDRVSAKAVFMVAMLAAVTYFLVPQLADIPGILDEIKDANWAWFPLVLLMSVLTYLGATMSLTGAVPNRLRTAPTFLTQLGSSFASKLAPAGAGGMALNVRYLQKAGVDTPVAASGVGLNSVGGFAMHMILMIVFLVWAGRSAFGSFKLPDPKYFLYGVAAVVVLAVIAFAIPAVRAQFRTRLIPVIKRSMGGVAAVMRRPGKLALLLGGSTVVTTSYIFAIYFSIRAFGGDLTFAQVGAIYLAGSTVASAAPTPGGLGALEAALIAGFVAAGMDNDVAVPSVFLYRFATFWIPILPGWACFTYLQRNDYI